MLGVPMTRAPSLSKLKINQADGTVRLDDNDEFPAPVWFEHRVWVLLDSPLLYLPVYILLGLAPFAIIAGGATEVVLGCLEQPSNSTVDGLSDLGKIAVDSHGKVKPVVVTMAMVGLFCFTAVWVALFHALRQIVRGAAGNHQRELAANEAAYMPKQAAHVGMLKKAVLLNDRDDQNPGDVTAEETAKLLEEELHRETHKEMLIAFRAMYEQRKEKMKGNGVPGLADLVKTITNSGPSSSINDTAGLGPFVTLAFVGATAGGINGRVFVGTSHHTKLRRWMWSMIAFGLFLLYAMLMISTGFVSIAKSRRDGTEEGVWHEGADTISLQVANLIFPEQGCAGHDFEAAYLILLLSSFVPAGCIAAVVIPVWILTLQVGTVLAADSVCDMMEQLDPQLVEVEYCLSEHNNQGRANWTKKVRIPGGLLVTRMRELCSWNTSMSCMIVGNTIFTVGLYPYAIVNGYNQLLACVYCSFASLVLLAWPPAELSSACQNLMEQLNEISFLGKMGHKQRCEQLLKSFERVNNGQGLGFLMFGAVVNKAKLVSIATTVATMAPLLSALEELAHG
jgi:hypothetical protein